MGFGSEASQFITLVNNEVHDNAYFVGTRGERMRLRLGHLNPAFLRLAQRHQRQHGSQLGLHDVVPRHRIYQNYNDLSTRPACTPTDGNGLIFDRNDGSCEAGLGCPSDGPNGGAALPKYYGRVLIANNIAWSNGGPGIHLYLSGGPIDILNTTLWGNNKQSTNVGGDQGEINLLGYYGDVAGAVVRIENNIMSTTGTYINSIRRYPYCFGFKQQSLAAAATIKNNLCYDQSGGPRTPSSIRRLRWSPRLKGLPGLRSR